MKTVLKRLLSFVLVAMMLVSVVPFQASAAPVNAIPVNVYIQPHGGSYPATPNTTKYVSVESGGTLTAAEVLSQAGYNGADYANWAVYEMKDGGVSKEMGQTESSNAIDSGLTGETSRSFQINLIEKQTKFNVTYSVNFTKDVTATTGSLTWTDIGAVTDELVRKAIEDNDGDYAAPQYNLGAATVKVNNVDVTGTLPKASAENMVVEINVPVYAEHAVTLIDEKEGENHVFDTLYTTYYKLDDRPEGEPKHDDWNFLRWDSYKTNFGVNLTSRYGETLTGPETYYARYEASSPSKKDGFSDLKIVGKFYVDGLLKGEKQLLTINDLPDGTNVYDILYKDSNKANVSDAIVEKLGTDGQWIDGKFYENDKGSEEITSKDVMNGERTVYVMVGKKGSIKVQLYVHTTYKEQPEYIINVFGFEDRDTLDRDDIKAVLKAKWPNRTYSFEGMYTNQAWTDVLGGKKDVTPLKTFPLYDEDVYTDYGVANVHIFAKLVQAQASDNPKTGDTILMAGGVLGVSAAALAVLFFLNKKKQVL